MYNEAAKRIIEEKVEKGEKFYVIAMPNFGERQTDEIQNVVSDLSNIMEEVYQSNLPIVDYAISFWSESYSVVFAYGGHFDDPKYEDAFDDMLGNVFVNNNKLPQIFICNYIDVLKVAMPKEEKQAYITKIKEALNYYFQNHNEGTIIVTNEEINLIDTLRAYENKLQKNVIVLAREGKSEFFSWGPEVKLYFVTANVKDLAEGNEAIDGFLKLCFKFCYWFDSVCYIGEN